MLIGGTRQQIKTRSSSSGSSSTTVHPQMAPDPEILKRKRSRPSDWWAATPTTPQEDEPPAKKRGGRPTQSAEGKGIKDAPAAGNRGKSAKGKEVVRDGENVEADELQEKPVRRGRSSDGREELIGTLRTPKTDGKLKGKTDRKVKGKTDGKAKGNTGRGIQKAGKDQISKKRGSRAVLQAKEQAEETDEDPIAPPKRRRPARRINAEPALDELVDDNSTRQKEKKKRRSGAEILAAEALALTTTEDYAKGRTRVPAALTEAPSIGDQGRGRKRTRRSDAQLKEVQPTASLPVDSQERGQTRTRRSDAGLGEVAMAGSSKQSIRSQRDQRVEVEASSSKLVSSRSGLKKGVKPAIERHTKSAQGFALAEQSQKAKKHTRSSNTGSAVIPASEPAQTRKKMSKRQSQANANSGKRKDVEKHPESQPVKRRRVEKPPQHDEDPHEAEEAPIYQHLQAVTHRVSRQIIEAKWEPLPSDCVERISQLLQDLQRPVLVRFNDERKKAQSSTALRLISRRLVNKISKGLPFPQGTRSHREDDFDFEKILDHNRALESQLTPALHANELLEARLNKEMALLESEREYLTNLEANAKTEATLRSEAARKLHSLLQPQGGTGEMAGEKDDIDLANDHIPRLLDPTIQDDEHLQALVKELHGHVDSIQGNIRQVEGVAQAISKSKAAVQATLFGHLDSTQYDGVVLGAE